MKFYSISFFCMEEPPLVNIHVGKDSYAPVTIKINNRGNRYANPEVVFHLSSVSDLIKFKNSVIEQYETYLRSKEVKDG